MNQQHTHGTVLVVNSGSSSIKYQLVDPVGGTAIASGIVERIGEEAGVVKHTFGDTTVERTDPVPDHAAGLRTVLGLFDEVGPQLSEAHVIAVGHRVVHGGSTFAGPAVVDDRVIGEIDALSPLAPLHNPPAVTGITVARELLPDVPHVVVFDTAFFHTLPEAAYTYAIDVDVAREHGVRRYGFHGTSHQYVSGEVARVLGRPLESLNQIVLHLGNGASASAVRGGVAVETSMGLTPLEGLVMGTRSGDIDAAVLIGNFKNPALALNTSYVMEDIDAEGEASREYCKCQDPDVNAQRTTTSGLAAVLADSLALVPRIGSKVQPQVVLRPRINVRTTFTTQQDEEITLPQRNTQP